MACRCLQLGLLKQVLFLCCGSTALIMLLTHFQSRNTDKVILQKPYPEHTSSVSSSKPMKAKALYKRSFKFSFEPGTAELRMPRRFWENSFQKRGSEFNIQLMPTTPYCSQDIWLLVLVKSAVPHLARRMSLRRIFNADKSIIKQARIVFVLGKDSSVNFSELKEEADLHDDVVIGNFVDTYRNLTLKSLFALTFFDNFCSDVRFVVSVDDDASMNLTDFRMYLSSMKETIRVLRCGDRINMAAKVMRRGKWSVENTKYDRTYFPPYCNGACFVMSGDVASALHEMSLKTHWDITIDDALITGILREKIKVNLSMMPKGICTHRPDKT